MRTQRQDTAELRRLRQQKRLEAAKRKRRKLLITLFILLALIIAGVYLVYVNSYTSMVNKGYQAIQSGDYDAAENYFNRAISKDRSRPDAYTGYAEIYVDQDDYESAEDVFLSAIETQPTNVEIYRAAIEFIWRRSSRQKCLHCSRTVKIRCIKCSFILSLFGTGIYTGRRHLQ